jgi:competence protein ComEC
MNVRAYLSKRVHFAWHIAFFGVGLPLGIAGSKFYSLPLSSIELATFLVVGLTVIAIKRFRYLAVFALVLGACVGLMRGEAISAEYRIYDKLYDSEVVLLGRVADDPSFGRAGDVRFKLTNVKIGDSELPGSIWVSVKVLDELKRGDIVSVSGNLKKGFGIYSASIFRAEVQDVVRPYPGDWVGRLRDKFIDSVKTVIPDPQASLGISFLMGMRKALPEDLSGQLRAIGLAHVVVASGYHLTIIASYSKRLFINKSKYLTFVSVVVVLIFFLLLTGFSTSMVRASAVTFLSAIAWYYGRVFQPIVLLSIVAAVSSFINPEYVWGDVAWFLSFSAFAGVIILAPLIYAYFWGADSNPGKFLQLLVTTFSAQLATLPIIVLAFGEYSVVGIISNVLILPVVPLAMLLVGLAGLLSFIFTPAAAIVGGLAVIVLNYILFIAELLSDSAQTTVSLGMTSKSALIFYLILTLISVYMWKKESFHFGKKDFFQKELTN